jgi:hypothetical protein
MSTVIVVVSVVVAIVLIGWFFVGKKSPAHGEGGRLRVLETESDLYYDRVDRPAGPDAEEMRSEPILADHADDIPPPLR